MSESAHDKFLRLKSEEKELLMEKISKISLELSEGAWTGSMGGHDPDFLKLRGGLKQFWIEKAAKDPHPFTYCVRHLRKHVANPERLCAWLKDQALGTTKWRNKNVSESAAWQPTNEELKSALMAYKEAAAELGLIKESKEEKVEEKEPQANKGGSGEHAQEDSKNSNTKGSEEENSSSKNVSADRAEDKD